MESTTVVPTQLQFEGLLESAVVQAAAQAQRRDGKKRLCTYGYVDAGGHALGRTEYEEVVHVQH